MPISWRWGREENKIINNITNQISRIWPDKKNLFINLTWFGPTFDNQNGHWTTILNLIESKEFFDHVFFLASVDPSFIGPNEREFLENNLNCTKCFWLGNFQTDYEFNFFAIVLKESFTQYTDDQILMKSTKHLFLNYNRKPRAHRVAFVEKLIESELFNQGVVTLGRDSSLTFSKQPTELYFSVGEQDENYADCNHCTGGTDFGIPDDVLSLHNIEIWQNHFLNIIGATEFFPWDPVFVTESQWKPILGLRPFVINGNTNTYSWLQKYGFKTFNHYFPVDFEVNEEQTHSTLISVLKYLNGLGQDNLEKMYQDMLPDLYYNRNRFYEYANEQQFKIYHLFQ
jgi:hypothetical protein